MPSILEMLLQFVLEPQFKKIIINRYLYLNHFYSFTDNKDRKGTCDLSRLISSVKHIMVNFLDYFPFQVQYIIQKNYQRLKIVTEHDPSNTRGCFFKGLITIFLARKLHNTYFCLFILSSAAGEIYENLRFL